MSLLPFNKEETNPYLDLMAGHDSHEAEMKRSRRDRGLMALGLFLLLGGSIAGNLYQMQQVKEIHHLAQVDEHGRVVSTLWRRTDEIPQSDPMKQLIIKRTLIEQVHNWRERPMDTPFLMTSLNTVLAQMAGPAGGKLQVALNQEKPWQRIKNERVEVEMKGQPIALTPNVWQAEWWEKITDQNGHPLRSELYSGRFQVAEKTEWVTPDNVFGVRIVDWGIDAITNKEETK